MTPRWQRFTFAIVAVIAVTFLCYTGKLTSVEFLGAFASIIALFGYQKYQEHKNGVETPNKE
jgi:hypothetical protein